MQTHSELFDYFEVFYNRRLHGAPGYQSPVEHENNLG